VATHDGHLISYHKGELINGVPFFIYDHGVNSNDEFTATFDFLGERYFAEIDMVGLKFDPYGKYPGEDFYGMDVQDISVHDLVACVEKSTNEIIVLTESWTEMNINSFDFDRLPFNEFRELEVARLVGYPNDRGTYDRKHDYWVSTDIGLAKYTSDIGRNDQKGWTEEGWQHYHKGNSFLRDNNVAGLEKVERTLSSELGRHFICWTQGPVPTIYLFHFTGERACIYDHTNSPMSRNKPIVGIDQVYGRSIYVCQGNRILKYEAAHEPDCSLLSSEDQPILEHVDDFYPNPSYGVIRSAQPDLIEKVDVLDSNGRAQMQIGYAFGQLDLRGLHRGLYSLVITYKDGRRGVQRIIITP
jgi:hypothetical protein